ncbi:MAG: acetyl-CoA carboxylase biotin carboxyl carrier protein [Acidobacteria bacterium]|nr:acetyl-CoA carboxylase biotin carboxyl carrier protein [Acidobacteriota bacterium]
MNFDEIKQILDMMREHELAEFELERDNVKLRLKKHSSGHWASTAPHQAPGHPDGAMPAPQAPAPPSGTPALTPAEDELELAVVKSPIVGTFYRSSEPGSKPYAEVGDVVKKGQVLCIIEAMKLMNEINAETDGEVVKVYVENGQAVQYGERLFAIKSGNV